MKYLKTICKILSKDVWFHIFSLVSVFLIITSFFIPPQGIIDSSVFVAVGELFAFAALWQISKAIDKGMDAKIQHHETTIEFNNPDKNIKDEDNAIS